MPRGLFFDVDDGFYWARRCLGREQSLKRISNGDVGLIEAAAILESSKNYRILSPPLDNLDWQEPVMLNPVLGRPLDAKTIHRYFRRFKPEYGNDLHSELASSLAYLNLYEHFLDAEITSF